MNQKAISVTEFVTIINETLGFAYPEVQVEGEVSSFKVSGGKFIFFDLKDDANVLSCFMMAFALKLPLADGMKVRVTGTPKVTRFSKFSLTARHIELAGEGELKRAMELLRKKLEAEGLFNDARKRPLPIFPRRIGLITSHTSAAYADFMKVLTARFGGLDVMLADVNVQGSQAPDQIVSALDYFNHLAKPVDVLVLIRGGGSLEDLIAFSTEPVARAVAASRTPIIVGVGHEIDFSLADFAADVRAATPTDAARLVVPDRNEIAARINHLSSQNTAALAARLTGLSRRVDQLLSRLESYLRHPRERLVREVTNLLRGLDAISHKLSSLRTRTLTLESGLTGAERHLLLERSRQLTSLQRLLAGYDPKAVLGRGYAIVRHDGHILTEAGTVQLGSSVMIQLAKGKLDATVSGRQK